MTTSYVPCYNYATPWTQIATSHPRKSYLAAPLRAYMPATPSIRSQQPTASQLPTSSADQCLNPPPSLPTLQTPQSTQPTAATPNNPNVVQAPAPLSPLTPARPTQVDSPNLDVQSRDLQLPTSPDEDSSMPPYATPTATRTGSTPSSHLTATQTVRT